MSIPLEMFSFASSSHATNCHTSVIEVLNVFIKQWRGPNDKPSCYFTKYYFNDICTPQCDYHNKKYKIPLNDRNILLYRRYINKYIFISLVINLKLIKKKLLDESNEQKKLKISRFFK